MVMNPTSSACAFTIAKPGKTIDLTPGFDQWVGGFAWAPDNNTIYFTAPDHARQPVFKTSVSAPKVEKVLEGMNDDLTVSPDGTWLLPDANEPDRSLRTSIASAIVPSGDAHRLLTHENDALLADLDMNPAEFVTTPGALGAEIQSLMLKPPGFDPAKKYPGPAAGSWRPAERLGRRLELSLECADVRRARLRGADDELPRLYRLWPEICGRRFPAIGVARPIRT